jgi:tetratricopeptide (TPR) repeat protein
MGLSDYLQLDGLAYRLVPIPTRAGSTFERGRIDSEIMYDNLMNKFRYGRMNEEDVYLDNFHLRTLSVIRLRYRFMRLANQLADEGDSQRAEEVLDRIMELTPHRNMPYHVFIPGIAESYYQLNKFEKGNKIFSKVISISDQYLNYYFSFNERNRWRIKNEIDYHTRVLRNAAYLTNQYNQNELSLKAQEILMKYSEGN